MSYLSIFKRIIPFFLTFAGGLLIASIFVPITAPFRNADGGGRWRRHNECRRDKEQLRRENDRLRQELQQLRLEADGVKFRTLDFDIPEIHVEAPAPPAPPRAVR